MKERMNRCVNEWKDRRKEDGVEGRRGRRKGRWNGWMDKRKYEQMCE
jgi:hypothetical protein